MWLSSKKRRWPKTVTSSCALIGDEATVKRLFVEKDHIRLQPENDAFEPIIVKEVVILGKVVSLLRYF